MRTRPRASFERGKISSAARTPAQTISTSAPVSRRAGLALAPEPQSLGASAFWIGPQVCGPSSQRTPTKRIISACAVTRPEPIDASLLGMGYRSRTGSRIALRCSARCQRFPDRRGLPAESRVNTTRPLARDPKIYTSAKSLVSMMYSALGGSSVAITFTDFRKAPTFSARNHMKFSSLLRRIMY